MSIQAIAKTDQPLLQNFGTKSNIVLMCAGKKMEHILELALGIKKLFELLFTMVCA
jgi:hypothetical protein